MLIEGLKYIFPVLFFLGNIEIVDSPYWPGSCWGYFFPYCPVDEALRVRIGPVEKYDVLALGNTHGPESNTRRGKFQ